MAAMNMDKKHKEYESLWEEEEDGKEEQTDPLETAGETEVTVEPAALQGVRLYTIAISFLF